MSHLEEKARDLEKLVERKQKELEGVQAQLQNGMVPVTAAEEKEIYSESLLLMKQEFEQLKEVATERQNTVTVMEEAVLDLQGQI